jgi:hypothetical protein
MRHGSEPAACDILIRSYWKDFAWLELCLQSIAQYARGFRSVIVVVPEASRPWLKRFHLAAPRLEVAFCANYRDDYLGQQVTKLLADTYTDAPFICHLDSDCILVRPVAPDELIEDGRPRVVMRPYEQLGRHWPWQRPTEEFLRTAVTHDFMQRPPFVYPRWIYPELRDFARAAHTLELERYILTCPTRGFSEFNVLGAFAKARHAADFVWIDARESDPGEPICRWYWSWGGVGPTVRREVKALLDKGSCP